MPHAPLLMLQRSVFRPMLRPVTVAVGLLASLMLAVPATTLQLAVATPVGGFAAITTLLDVPHTLWSGPATAACASPSASVMVMVLLVIPFGQLPLVTVQVNSLTPT